MGKASRIAWLVGALLVLACCGGPSDDQFAELVDIEENRLTNIVVDNTEKFIGNWILVTGTGTIRDDLYLRVESARGAELCGITRDEFDLAVWPFGQEQRLKVVEPGTFGGREVEFAVELVPSKVDENFVDSDGDEVPPDQVTSQGWWAGASGGGFTVDGTRSSALDLGWPPEWWNGLEDAIIVGTAEFDAFCQSAAT